MLGKGAGLGPLREEVAGGSVMEPMRGHREGSQRRKMDALGRGTEGERQGGRARRGPPEEKAGGGKAGQREEMKKLGQQASGQDE